MHQLGFIADHSAKHHLHKVIDYVASLCSLELKNYVDAVFFDLCHKLDLVWNERLLFKLKNVFPMNYYLIVHSFLKFKQYFVSENNSYSPVYRISVVGPLDSVFVHFSFDITFSPVIRQIFMQHFVKPI